MRAVYLEAPGVMRVGECPAPGLTPGSALLRVDAAAICGSDVRAYRYGSAVITYPHILGHEVAATVLEVSGSTPGLSPGDRVVIVPAMLCGECRACRRGYPPDLCERKAGLGWHYQGGLAEQMLLPPPAVSGRGYVHIPQGLAAEHACLAEPIACALRGLEQLDLSPGESLVVVGAGPIGLLLCLLARARGARSVILVQRSAHRLERAREMQVADSYLRSTQPDLLEKVKSATDNWGADAAICAAPSAEAAVIAVEAVHPRGRVNFFAGLPRDRASISLDANRIHYQEIEITGTAGATAEATAQALAMMASGELSPERLISHRLSLAEVPQGFDLVARGEALKVVVIPRKVADGPRTGRLTSP